MITIKRIKLIFQTNKVNHKIKLFYFRISPKQIQLPLNHFFERFPGCLLIQTIGVFVKNGTGVRFSGLVKRLPPKKGDPLPFS